MTQFKACVFNRTSVVNFLFFKYSDHLTIDCDSYRQPAQERRDVSRASPLTEN